MFGDRQRDRKRVRSPSRETDAKQRKSVVAQIVQREQIPEEEYDPLNPQIGSMASVVRVTQRKISLPSDLQAKPGIFLRALNAANESAKLKRTIRVDEVEGGSGMLF